MIRKLSLAFALILYCLPAMAAEPAPATFNVKDFGATGDGQTKDTIAVQKALDACAAAGGGTVVVPAGVYLIGSIVIGPGTTLQLESRANLMGSPDIGDYSLVRLRWEGEFVQGHRALISAEKADHIAITGRGSIFGPPLSLSRLRNPRGPALIELSECKHVLLEGFSTQYQQLWSIHLLCDDDVTARNLVIRTINFNGDGIDVDSCRDVLIDRCDINTGDDAISLKSGRGMEAVRLARPTENVVIRDCSLVSSIYAGLGIGTELSGGIRHVRLENCTVSGRQNAIFIKSRDGRGAVVEDIAGENLVIGNSPTFLAIDLLKKGIQASEPVPGDVEKWTRVHNVRFSHIQVNHVEDLVLAQNVPPEQPVDGLSLTDIKGACDRGITLSNMVNVQLAGIDVTGFHGPLITKTNVHDAGPDSSGSSR